MIRKPHPSTRARTKPSRGESSPATFPCPSDAWEGMVFEGNQLLDGIVDGLRIVNASFDTVRVNQGFLRLAGLTRTQALRTKCYEQFGGSQCHTKDCRLERAKRGERLVQVESVKNLRNGSRIPCLITASPILGPEGDFQGIIETFRDIGSLMKEKNQLRAFRDSFEFYFENFPESCVVLSKRGNILKGNHTLLATLGYRGKELLGKPLKALILESSQAAFDLLLSDLDRSRRVKNREVRLQPRVGEFRTFLVSAQRFPVSEEEEGAAFLLLLTDITEKTILDAQRFSEEIHERKKAQEQSLAAERTIQKKDQALDEILFRIEAEKKKIHSAISFQVSEILFPVLRKMEADREPRKFFGLVRHILENLLPDGDRIQEVSAKLSPREIQICSMIKAGLAGKDIARTICLSEKTIATVRRNIRRKLGIANKKVNLVAFLRTGFPN